MGINKEKADEDEDEDAYIDSEDRFGVYVTIDCYCGNKVKIEYDETKGKKNTKCEFCGYSHLDLVYTMRKQAEQSFKSISDTLFKKRKA